MYTFHLALDIKSQSRLTNRCFVLSKASTTSEAAIRAMCKVHNAVFQVLQNRKAGIDPTSADDLIITITKSKYLWNKFRMELHRNNMVTNMAVKEHLFIFLAKNREFIEKEHDILKSPKLGSITNTSSNASYCIGNLKNSFRSLTNMIQQNSEKETNAEGQL